MNKYQEALDHIIKCDREDGEISHLSDAYRNDISALQELVNRATPKKPEIKELIRKDNYRDGTNIPRYDWWCPNCHLEHFSTNIIKHCTSCGQALDWSDE